MEVESERDGVIHIMSEKDEDGYFNVVAMQMKLIRQQ